MTKPKPLPTDPELYAIVQESVKRRTARWPNAYASGQVVQEYKRAMEEKGLPPYQGKKPDVKVGLARWYREDWQDIATGKPCGSVKTSTYYPTCRPGHRVTAKSPVPVTDLSPAQKASMVKQKQTAKTKTVTYKETRKTT